LAPDSYRDQRLEETQDLHTLLNLLILELYRHPKIEFMKFIAQLVVSALAVIVSSLILPGVHIDNAITGVIVAAVLAFLNAIVKPVLVILTIPITVFTLGIFLLVINALMILLAARIVDGFHVEGFWIALLFSLVLSLVSSVFDSIASTNKKEE
jgi:putative membrane protein